MKKKICAQCRESYADCDDPEVEPAEAEFYVKGKRYDPHDGTTMPYRANLCRAHVETMQEDGSEFKVIRKL